MMTILKLLSPVGKFLIPAIIGIAIGGFGMAKLQKPVCPERRCPDCNCPEPTVSVQPFDVDKIKGLREFNYAPQFTGSIQVAGVDSSSIRRMIDVSVDKAFQKYMVVNKKGRRVNNDVVYSWRQLHEGLKDRNRKLNKWDSIFRLAAHHADSVLADRIKELTHVDESIFEPLK